jgi:NADH-quinone oxidoreductase subunit N
LILVLVGLGFKIAAAPFQIWAPDVYQGAPTPTTALLALGSKAAGFVLLLRVLFMMAPEFATQWQSMLLVVSGATIIYGNLCAIPQRNLQRLMGYSSIAHAGYLLLGVAALSANGVTAVLFYFGAYLFAVLAAFTVICLALRQADIQDLSALAGLHQRSPLLAATLALAMISLAGIPPLAGFFGKFLLLKAILEQGSICVGCYWLAGAALIGIVISLYYYLNVVRAIYWSKAPTDSEPINVSPPMKLALGICVLGLFYFGVMPGALLAWAEQAARMFNLS